MMRLDGPVTDLTDVEKKMAKIAGIPADRPGLGAEYPKMVYRPGKNERHVLLGDALPIGNGKLVGEALGRGVECQTAFVDTPEDEAEALAEGWFLTPDPDGQKVEAEKRKADTAKDDEIAALKAQLAKGDRPKLTTKTEAGND